MMRIILATSVLCFAAFATPASADVNVAVSFSPNIKRVMPSIDSTEKRREEHFRKFRHDQVYGGARSSRRLARTYYHNVNWANEMLVPEIDDFNVANLLTAMVKKNMEIAGLDDAGGTISIRIKRLRVSNHPVARLNGASTYVTGSIGYVDASGNVESQAEISANLVVDPTVNTNYQGPDFAYSDTDPNQRVGPALAYFVQQGLEELFPDRKFAKPVSITFPR